jgi:hypothetical protein
VKKKLSKKSASIGVALSLAVNAGCVSNASHEETTPSCVGQPTNPDCILDVHERSFVRAALPVTDGVSTATVSHTPGRFCMSGSLDPGPNNTNWGALLVLPLTEDTPTAPFSAAARGIAQVEFTLDPPPAAGLTVTFAAFERADCLDVPDCLTAAPFVLADGSGAEIIVDESGTIAAALTSFVQPSWGDPALTFDPDLIEALQFGPQLLPGVVLPYDFCVRNVRFLDAAGREVSP